MNYIEGRGYRMAGNNLSPYEAINKGLLSVYMSDPSWLNEAFDSQSITQTLTYSEIDGYLSTHSDTLEPTFAGGHLNAVVPAEDYVALNPYWYPAPHNTDGPMCGRIQLTVSGAPLTANMHAKLKWTTTLTFDNGDGTSSDVTYQYTSRELTYISGGTRAVNVIGASAVTRISGILNFNDFLETTHPEKGNALQKIKYGNAAMSAPQSKIIGSFADSTFMRPEVKRDMYSAFPVSLSRYSSTVVSADIITTSIIVNSNDEPSDYGGDGTLNENFKINTRGYLSGSATVFLPYYAIDLTYSAGTSDNSRRNFWLYVRTMSGNGTYIETVTIDTETGKTQLGPYTKTLLLPISAFTMGNSLRFSLSASGITTSIQGTPFQVPLPSSSITVGGIFNVPSGGYRNVMFMITVNNTGTQTWPGTVSNYHETVIVRCKRNGTVISSAQTGITASIPASDSYTTGSLSLEDVRSGDTVEVEVAVNPASTNGTGYRFSLENRVYGTYVTNLSNQQLHNIAFDTTYMAQCSGQSFVGDDYNTPFWVTIDVNKASV